MDPVLALQVTAGFLFSFGYCWLLGSFLARVWLLRASGGAAPAQRLRKYDLGAAALLAVGAALLLFAGAAAMSGLPLAQAHSALPPMLGTAFGRAGSVLLCAALACLGWRLLAQAAWAWIVELVLLLVLTATRAAMGHAGEAGWFTPVHLVELVHLAAIGAWVGIVLVSAGPALARQDPLAMPGGPANAYLARMSAAALVAVLLVGASGAFNVWHRIGSTALLLPANAYIVALTVKLCFVATALFLGGANKLWGLPAAARAPEALTMVRAVLLVEALVLTLALLAAAWLTVLAPPALDGADMD